jgi:UPF0716 family protein affecting phage T7 exclusion
MDVDTVRSITCGWYSTAALVLWIAGWVGILAALFVAAAGIAGVVLLALAGLAEYRARNDAHPEARGMMRGAR